MSDFRWDGGFEMTPKNWTLEGKNRTLGGWGVKNHQKSSDIIYGCSLSHIWLLGTIVKFCFLNKVHLMISDLQSVKRYFQQLTKDEFEL